MKTLTMAFGVVLLFACLAFVQTSAVQVGMISTQEAVAAQQAQADRDKVHDFLSRASVQEKMQALGVEATFAKERVDALTVQEVTLLAQRIDALPAGGALSNTDIVIILLVAILVAIAL
ncbi:PA2779 family protein [Pseudomonas sp. 2FG]|uniref:PA2779 family protein n=1 Tax=Pseudomonas sp. 2FG TaxID=2502191 RepID=UPI0010F4F010|nr:PA2779 family protein [Pseudomonas sp. 2FG]